MPPPRRPPHRHRHPLSALSGAADPDRLADALTPIIPDPHDRAFVVRCILGDGPAHHRAASWALLVLAADIAARLGANDEEPAPEDDSVTVRLRIPPHLATTDDSAFPLRLPMAPLRAIARNERDVEALADALVDGPPHHALANAALVSIFDRILTRLAAQRPAG